MRFLLAILALFIACQADAQDKAPQKKPLAKKQVAHKKPTPEQIKKFRQLQKQREAKG